MSQDYQIDSYYSYFQEKRVKVAIPTLAQNAAANAVIATWQEAMAGSQQTAEEPVGVRLGDG